MSSHKCNKPCLSLLSALRESLHFHWYLFLIPMRIDDWVGLDSHLHTEVWVTHRNINWTWRVAILFMHSMPLLLYQLPLPSGFEWLTKKGWDHANGDQAISSSHLFHWFIVSVGSIMLAGWQKGHIKARGTICLTLASRTGRGSKLGQSNNSGLPGKHELKQSWIKPPPATTKGLPVLLWLYNQLFIITTPVFTKMTMIGWRNVWNMKWKVGASPRGTPKKTWTEIVEKDCQARKWNGEDAMDHTRWMKQIRDNWWPQ